MQKCAFLYTYVQKRDKVVQNGTFAFFAFFHVLKISDFTRALVSKLNKIFIYQNIFDMH
jgi:hypothetical protein